MSSVVIIGRSQPNISNSDNRRTAVESVQALPSRVVEIDQVRGLAIIAVIILHTVPAVGPVVWVNALVFAQCVPIFLMLMGYNGIKSYRRRVACGTRTLSQSYDRAELRRKLLRLIVPFGILWLFSLAQGLLRGDAYFGPRLLIGYLPYSGPGNYFVVIALQFVLLAPLMCWTYVRRPKLTVLTLVGLDLAFELAAVHLPAFDVPFAYSACILRYAAAIGLGLWVADDERLASRRNWFVLPLGVLGFCYIIVALSSGLALPFRPNWGTQNLLSFGWALVLLLGLLQTLRAHPLRGMWASQLSRFGQASYGIYVFQIGWFSLGLWPLISRASTSIGLPIAAKVVFVLLLLSVNLAVCLWGGRWWQEHMLERLNTRLNAGASRTGQAQPSGRSAKELVDQADSGD